MENLSSITKYFLLAELRKREMNGYELASRITDITGRKPSPSQIYPVLKEMKRAGYVTVKTGERKAKYYKLTKSGKMLSGTMSRKFEGLVKSALKEKIKICVHCGCEIIKGSYSRNFQGKMMNFCCRSCADAAKLTH